MSRKISARTALLDTGLSPADDLLGIVDYSAGSFGSKKITINHLISGWGMTDDGAALAKADSVEAQRILLGFDNLEYKSSITGLTGGGVTKLDGITTVGLSTGRVQVINLSGQLSLYRLFPGVTTESSPERILPDDYNAVTNAKYWTLVSIKALTITAGSVDCNIVQISTSDGVGVGSISPIYLTTEREHYLPDANGSLGLYQIVNDTEMEEDGSISLERYKDQRVYLYSSVTIAEYTINLPDGDNARIGQIIRIIFNAVVTTLNVLCDEGNIEGTALVEAAANVSYDYECITNNEDGPTWLRTK